MISFIKGAIRAWFAGYTTTGKFWLGLGILALAVDAAISYQYGITLTTLHGLGFALVAMFFALLPDAAYTEVESRRVASGIALGLLCVPLGIVAFYSHLGYGAGVRLGNVQQTSVHNAKFEDTRAALTSERTNLDMWRKQLSDLKSRNAEHAAKNNGWLVSVDPVAMETQMAALDQKIDNEAKRVRCGAKCEKLKEQKGQLASLIGNIKEENDLTARIEATQRIVDGKTAKVAEATFESSPVVNQNSVAAQLFLAFTGAAPEQAINPDDVTTSFTSIVIAGGGSLALMIMAPVGFFVAGRNRRQGSSVGGLNPFETAVKPAATVPPVPRYQAPAPTYSLKGKTLLELAREHGIVHNHTFQGA